MKVLKQSAFLKATIYKITGLFKGPKAKTQIKKSTWLSVYLSEFWDEIKANPKTAWFLKMTLEAC